MKNLFNQRLISFIMATFSYFVFCNNGILKSYDVSSWLIYVLIIIIFGKTDILGRKNKKESIVFSAILSFIIIFGAKLYINIDNREVSVLREMLSINTIYNFICYFNILFIVFKNLFPKLYSMQILETSQNKISNKKLFIICFIIILLAWLPYFLTFYPGTLTPDSLSEYDSISNGIHIVSDHHPVLHALFVGVFYNLGMLIFNSKITSIAVVTIVQMFILSAIFAYTIIFLRQRNIKKSILIILLLCYSFLPMNGYYSVVMWKDVLFAGSLILLTTELIKLVEKDSQKEISKKDVLSFIFVSLICVFFRNNAIYMYLLLFIVLLILVKKSNRKIISIACVIVLACYLCVKGPVFKFFGVNQSESSEYIGIPLQQVGRMAFKYTKFTKNETEILNQLIPVEVMRDAYNPRASDGIKFHSYYNREVFDENKFKFLNLYIKLVLKHPSIAIEAYSISTLGFWYPGVEYWSVANGIWENDSGLETRSIIFKNNPENFIRKIESRSFPVLSIEWSVGIYFWLMFISFYVSLRKNWKKAIIIFTPCIGIWITMMLASPVFAEFRYVYCVMVTIPLLMLYPYMSEKKCKVG